MYWLGRVVKTVVGVLAVMAVMGVDLREVSAMAPVSASAEILAVAPGEGGANDPTTVAPKSDAADESDKEVKKVETNILPADTDIEGLLRIVVSVLVYGLGAAAILGIVVAGLQYLTARDNEAQVAAAKKRLLNVVIGLVAWAVMFFILDWLIPGGINLG